MWVIAIMANAILGAILAPFRTLPGLGLLIVSVLTGVVMLLIFGRTSNQKAIRGAKAKLKAHVAEIWLFKDDLGQMLLATVRVLGHTGRYFVHSLRPLIFIFAPVLIVMVMLGVRFAHRPFRPSESAMVAVVVDERAWTQDQSVRLEGSDGVEIVTPALRIPDRREIDWRIRVRGAGTHLITVSTPRGTASKRIEARENSRPLVPLAASRGRAFSAAFLEYPVEPPLPASSGVREIRVVDWPEREMRVLGLSVNWLVAFFILSMAAGFAVKDVLGVEV
jgi:uncharacterized membrane protein (DUF106 family)